MIRRLLCCVALVVVLGTARPSVVSVCSCVPFTKPEYARQATLVFTGTVTRIDVRGGPLVLSSLDPVEVVFDVETAYKGDMTRTMTVVTARGEASCGYGFAIGRRYTVFPWAREGKLEAGLCNGTVEGPIDPQAYLLGSGYPPGPDAIGMRALVLAGAVLATIALIVWERRRGVPTAA